MEEINQESKKNLENGGEENDNKQPVNESDLIEELKEETDYLTLKYNEERQKKIEAEKKMKEKEKENGQKEKLENRPKGKGILAERFSSRAGGIYIPPHKLRRMREQMMQEAKEDPKIEQRFKWELLRKSINEIINKVNVSNIQNVIIELLNENILRGKGLVARAIIKGQMSSPNFTQVYSGLVAVINTKLPEIANLIIKRVILQFRRSYQRNSKIVCKATTKFLAHLINQRVLTDFFGLELLAFLLQEPTEDSVDIACEFMKEAGQVLSDLTPAGVNAIFERFKGILHEGEIARKVQYSIENLFAIRKNGFLNFPGVIPELDLVEEEEQIIHNISLDDQIDGETKVNIFRFEDDFGKNEEEWNEIKTEILGEDNILMLKTATFGQEESEEESEEEENIKDFTEEDVLKLRQNIYLIIMNSVDFEACAHKLMKLGIGTGHEDEFCEMIVDCCMKERTYLKFYGLLAERFCNIDDAFKQQFFRLFVEKYTTIHRYKTNKIRNLSKIFGHLLLTDALDWHVLKCVTLTENATSSASRIFLKLLFQDLAENMGLKDFVKKIQDPEMGEYFVGLFPKDHPKNTRFAINFFGLIGLDAATSELKKFLEKEAELNEEELALLAESSSDTTETDSSEEDSSGSNDDDTSVSESSGSEEGDLKDEEKKKKMMEEKDKKSPKRRQKFKEDKKKKENSEKMSRKKSSSTKSDKKSDFDFDDISDSVERRKKRAQVKKERRLKKLGKKISKKKKKKKMSSSPSVSKKSSLSKVKEVEKKRNYKEDQEKKENSEKKIRRRERKRKRTLERKEKYRRRRSDSRDGERKRKDRRRESSRERKRKKDRKRRSRSRHKEKEREIKKRARSKSEKKSESEDKKKKVDSPSSYSSSLSKDNQESSSLERSGTDSKTHSSKTVSLEQPPKLEKLMKKKPKPPKPVIQSKPKKERSRSRSRKKRRNSPKKRRERRKKKHSTLKSKESPSPKKRSTSKRKEKRRRKRRKERKKSPSRSSSSTLSSSSLDSSD